MNEGLLLTTSAYESCHSHCENRPFPSSPRSHFQDESRSLLGISVFIHIEVNNKSCASRLAFKETEGTSKMVQTSSTSLKSLTFV